MFNSHHVTEKRFTKSIKKVGKFIFNEELFSASPKSAPQCNKPRLNPNCTLLQTISVNPRTVSCSERLREKEKERRGSDWRKRGVLVHNYSRDLWPEKQFINHSAWANVLQIVLHAAAILVCVKRHNKPGWRTCMGGGGAGRKVEVVGGGWCGWGCGLAKFLRCFEQRNWELDFFFFRQAGVRFLLRYNSLLLTSTEKEKIRRCLQKSQKYKFANRANNTN